MCFKFYTVGITRHECICSFFGDVSVLKHEDIIHVFLTTVQYCIVWMDSHFLWMFQCPAQIFSTGCCTDPHHICHEYWLTASQPFPSLENCHQLNGATLLEVLNMVGAACSQWQTSEIYKRLPFCQGGTKSDTTHAPQLVILYSSN